MYRENKYQKIKYEFGEIMRDYNFTAYLRTDDDGFMVFIYPDNSTDTLLKEKIPLLKTAKEIITYLKNKSPGLFL